MPIDNAVLLQVDITAIVGIFIFLTIEELALGKAGYQQRRIRWFHTSFLVIPFAVSALAILIEDNWSTSFVLKGVQQHVDIPKWAAIAGFAYILIVFVFILGKMPKAK
ncbi:MAG: hypothetical protein WA941_16445 [Nitrososphaeraceae archaeon]